MALTWRLLSPKPKVFYPLLWGVALILWITLNASYQAERKGQRPADRGPTTTFFPKRVYQILSLGYPQVFADWFWIQAMQFPFDPAVQHSRNLVVAPNAGHLRMVTELDPHFFEFYYSGGNELMVVRRDADNALWLASRGLEWYRSGYPKMPARFREQRWSQAWGLSLLSAYVWLFEKNDLPRAAEAFREAASLPNAPAYLGALAKRLDKPGGAYEVGFRLVNGMLAQAENLEPEKKARLIAERNSLYLGQTLQELTEQFDSYLKKRPGYAAKLRFSQEELQSAWRAFTKQGSIISEDPWGGVIYLDDVGVVQSTTPRIKVFNLE